MGGKGSGGYRKNALPRDKNPVVQAADPSNVDAGVNARVMAFGARLMAFDPPDFSDAEDVERRFYDFLGLCGECGIRPMVTSMANAFGMRRQELYGIAMGLPNFDHWRHDALTPASRIVLQKAYNFLSTAWETYLMEEKGNPVKWIFLGKNYFGMRDQTERVEMRMDVPAPLPAAEDVAAKYAAMVGQGPAASLPAQEVEVEDVTDGDS